MNKKVKETFEFLKKNKLIIFIILGLIILLQVFTTFNLNRGNSSLNEDVGTESIITANDVTNTNNLNFKYLLFAALLVMLLYFAKKRGWLDRFMPKTLYVRLKIDKKNHAKIKILNRTGNSVSIERASLVFGKKKYAREFKLKSNSEKYLLPLTLVDKTDHIINIDLNKFYEAIPDLNRRHSIKIKIFTSSGKVFTSRR